MRRPALARGFTLLELLIATAIFSLLGLVVVYLMRQGLGVFATGTTESSVQDRADTVLPILRKDLLALYAGDRFDPPPPPPSERDLGTTGKEPPPPPPVDVRLRAGFVRMKDVPEGPLRDVDCPFGSFVIATSDEWRDPLRRKDPVPGTPLRELSPTEVNDPKRAGQPFAPGGGLMEVCWIAVAEDPATPGVMTLRRGFRSPIGGEGTLLDPANLDTLEEVRRRCPIVERGILFVGMTWRNAFATTFEAEVGGGMDETDPYVGPVWDSTRALDRTFRFFRGLQSLGDPSDDRFPSAVRLQVTLASAGPRGFAPDTFLREPVDDASTRIRVLDANPLFALRARPAGDERWVKVDGEWMRFRVSATNPDVATGEVTVERGRRGTRATAHAANAPAYVGLAFQQDLRMRMSRDAYARRSGGPGAR